MKETDHLLPSPRQPSATLDQVTQRHMRLYSKKGRVEFPSARQRPVITARRLTNTLLRGTIHIAAIITISAVVSFAMVCISVLKETLLSIHFNIARAFSFSNILLPLLAWTSFAAMGGVLSGVLTTIQSSPAFQSSGLAVLIALFGGVAPNITGWPVFRGWRFTTLFVAALLFSSAHIPLDIIAPMMVTFVGVVWRLLERFNVESGLRRPAFASVCAAVLTSAFSTPLASSFFILFVLMRGRRFRPDGLTAAATFLTSTLTPVANQLWQSLFNAEPQQYLDGTLLWTTSSVSARTFWSGRMLIPISIMAVLMAIVIIIWELLTFYIQKYRAILFERDHWFATTILSWCAAGLLYASPLLVQTPNFVFNNLVSSSGSPSELSSLRILLLVYSLASALSYGPPLIGSPFITIILIGAAFGRICGLTLSCLDLSWGDHFFSGSWVPIQVSPALFAYCGVAASLSSMTQSPLVGALFATELSGRGDFLIPFLTAALISFGIRHIFGRNISELPVYADAPLVLRSSPPGASLVTVGSFAKILNGTLPPTITFGELNDFLYGKLDPRFPIVDANKDLYGVVLSAELSQIQSYLMQHDAPLDTQINLEPPLLRSDYIIMDSEANLEMAYQLLHNGPVTYMLVFERGEVHGYLTKADLYRTWRGMAKPSPIFNVEEFTLHHSSFTASKTPQALSPRLIPSPLESMSSLPSPRDMNLSGHILDEHSRFVSLTDVLAPINQ